MTKSVAPRGSIDYLSRRDQLTLPLLQADAETFADLLSLLSKYEGEASSCQNFLALADRFRGLGPRRESRIESWCQAHGTSPPERAR